MNKTPAPAPAPVTTPGPGGLALRAADPSDTGRVLALWRTAAKGTSISDDPAGLARLIDRDPDALLLAERDGELVGTVIAGFDGWRCHLYRLAVHPGHRRQGIGTALLAAAERRFTALGGRRADAMVLRDNSTAHGAWQAAGYHPQQQWIRWTKPLRPTADPHAPTTPPPTR